MCRPLRRLVLLALLDRELSPLREFGTFEVLPAGSGLFVLTSGDDGTDGDDGGMDSDGEDGGMDGDDDGDDDGADGDDGGVDVGVGAEDCD
jgi:hypothetical protein